MAAAQSHVDIEEKKIQKSYFDVLGICCPSEVPLIESILKNLDGVKDVSVIVPTKTVIVLHDTLLISQLQIVKALNKARLEASVRVEGVKSSQQKWPSPFAIGSGVLLLLSFLKYLYHPFQWLALGAVAFGIIPILFRAVTALRNLTFGDINILVVITVVGSVALKDYWEAGTIVFLFTISEWLESLVSHKATAAMSSLVNLVPQRAILAETGEEVDVSKVKLNTVLAVKDGEVIPIDGVVIEGKCEVDEKTLTGESFPVAKQKDSNVWAGTINVNGYISIETTALAEDCVVARMTRLVEEAQSNRSRIQRYIEKFAMYYTPAIVVISAALAVVPAVLRVHNERVWFHIALVVLVSACPCALILSTPVAMFCALTKAAKSGVFFKGANYLETLAKVKIMAFDKTGTVTRAEFEVTEFRSLSDDISLSTMLYWISSIESKSSHPMAAALVDFALSHSVEPKPEKVEQFQNFPGEGIYGKVDGKDIYIGNLRISLRAGCPSVPKLDGNFGEGNSVGYMFLGSTPAGIFSLADVCRTGADDALNELKSMGIKTVMLTGDSYVAAKHAQDQLGGTLEVVHAELLPEDKARIVKDYQKVACTAMIGDGINDAPALATADIGISMGISGSALATETGHVILMTNDIQRIPKVARLARRVRRKILENMILSVAIKGSILALAIAGHPIVWAAVLADVGTCLLVIFNSMLLLRGTKNYPKKCRRSSTVSLSDEQINKCSGSDLSNAHQPCCDVIERKSCKMKTCSSMNCTPRHQSGLLSSSSSSCGSSTLSEFTEKRSCCGDGNGSKRGKCSDSRSYNNDAKPVGELVSHNRGHTNCTKSIRSLGESISISKEQNDKSSECCLSHTQKPCCGDIKPQKCYEVQACSSKKCAPVQHSGALNSNSCGSDKYSDKGEKSCCGHSNQVPKAQFSDQGRCRSLSSNSCCSNFPDSTEKRNCCEQGNGIQKGKWSDVRSYNNNVKPKEELDTHGKSPGSQLSHAQKLCAYDIESQKNCEVQACSSKNCAPVNHSGALSSSSCRSTKCSDSKDKESCCEHGNRNLKVKSSDHGCFSRNDEHKGSTTPCHGQINCSNSSRSLGDGIINSLNHHCRHSSDPCSQLTSKNEVLAKNSPKYPKEDLITDQELGEPIKVCCDLDQTNNVHSSCKNHAAECCPPYHSISDNIGVLNNAGCRARRTCMTLEKRCVGGCCESFRKECCGSGQLGVSLIGGLSEIIIE